MGTSLLVDTFRGVIIAPTKGDIADRTVTLDHLAQKLSKKIEGRKVSLDQLVVACSLLYRSECNTIAHLDLCGHSSSCNGPPRIMRPAPLLEGGPIPASYPANVPLSVPDGRHSR